MSHKNEKPEKREKRMNESGFVDSAVDLAMVLIVLVVISGVAIILGGQMDQVVESNPAPSGSLFNGTENPDMVTGGQIWDDNATYIGIIVMIFVFAIILSAVYSFRRKQG